jgi:hypothetical protein
MLPAASVTADGSTAVTITAPRRRRTAVSPAAGTVSEVLIFDRASSARATAPTWLRPSDISEDEKACPAVDADEITDKGYVNQRTVLARRAKLVEMLYAEPAPRGRHRGRKERLIRRPRSARPCPTNKD